MANIMQTGLSALTASQRALATASHNIANINTPGYTRQRVELATNRPESVGGATRPQYVGNGVSAQSISRVYDGFLTEQARNYGSSVGQLAAKDRWISQLDSVLGDGSTGLAPAVKQFFASAQDVANSPASSPERQVLLSQAETLANQFNNLDSQINVLRDGVNEDLRGAVTTINGLTENIAKANYAIATSSGGSGGASPDLLDQRDQLVANLAQKVSVNTVVQSDGSMSVFAGNGQSLVLGSQSNALETKISTADPRKLDIQFKADGSVITNSLSNGSGEVSGLLAFQDQVLDPAQNKLGLMAAGLADTFNAQHKLGMDLNGKLGGNFFTTSDPQVVSNSTNTNKSASLSATITDIGKVQPSDYEVKYDGANYSAVRVSDQTIVKVNGTGLATMTLMELGTELGLSLTKSFTPAAGDRFLIQPTRSMATSFGVKIKDPSLFAAAAPIKTSADQVNTGTGKISAGEALDTSTTTAGKLLNSVEIRFSTTVANQFDVFDVSGATPVPLASNITYTPSAGVSIPSPAVALSPSTYGWQVAITGTPAKGDVFKIGSNAGGVGDNRNALKLAGLQTGKTLLNGASTYQDVQNQMVSEVGTQGSTTRNTLKTQEALQEQAVQARDSVSGVNLDEEAANLMKYQRSYEAAAKVIQIGDSIIQSLLDVVRG
ncbi:MAG: flagellar hook-associated protein FlgK [Candidatus Competibacteraceae bacterium]